jgi:peptide/nickel transport system substrate-binding protein
MKKLRLQLFIAVLALVAIGILLVGQQPALQQITPVQPTEGGVYSEGLIGSFGRLNPVLDYYNQVDRDVDRLIFCGLVRFGDRGIPESDLAESWGISADGKVYNFSIRSNAVWHDGQAVVSDDIIYTVDLLRNDQIPLPKDQIEFWKQVQVDKLDDHTLQFRLPEAYAPFLDYLTFGILPKHIWENVTADQLANSEINLNPVGCGPFKFDHLTSESGQVKSVTLAAFEDYYVRRPYIDQVNFHYYPDAASAISAYQEGNIMGIGHITQDILPATLSEEDLNLYSGRLPELTLIYLNLNNSDVPFFQNLVVRRALLMGINRQWIIDRVLGGQSILADGPVFPGMWAYYDEIEHIKFDTEKALASLKEDGYTIPAEGGNVRAKEGVALTFEMVYPDDPKHQAIAEAIQKNWMQLGVQVNLKAVPYQALISQYLEPRTYQAALVDLNLSRSPDPDPYPFWDQAQINGGQNYAQWDDRQASEYLEKARVAVDIEERAQDYRNFQVRFTTEMPALPLFYPVYSYAVNNQVQNVRVGYFFDPSDRFNTILDWYLRAKRPVGSDVQLTPTP